MQIGPRIRVGGSVGHAGQQIKLGTGKVLSNKYVDMGLSLIPGVGPGIAAAANVAGRVLDTSKGGIHSVGDVANIAKDAGMVYAGGRALGAAKGAIAQHGVKDALKGAVTSGLSKAKQLTSGGGASDGGGGSGLLDKLLLGGGVVASAMDRKRHQDMQDRASHYATDSYDSRAGLREKGTAGALNNAAPNLSSTFSDPGNAYDVQKRKPVAPSPMATAPVRRTLTY